MVPQAANGVPVPVSAYAWMLAMKWFQPEKQSSQHASWGVSPACRKSQLGASCDRSEVELQRRADPLLLVRGAVAALSGDRLPHHPGGTDLERRAWR